MVHKFLRTIGDGELELGYVRLKTLGLNVDQRGKACLVIEDPF